MNLADLKVTVGAFVMYELLIFLIHYLLRLGGLIVQLSASSAGDCASNLDRVFLD